MTRARGRGAEADRLTGAAVKLLLRKAKLEIRMEIARDPLDREEKDQLLIVRSSHSRIVDYDKLRRRMKFSAVRRMGSICGRRYC